MRRLSLFHSIEWLLRQKRRLSPAPVSMPKPDPIEVIPDAVIEVEDNVFVEESPSPPLHLLDTAPVNSKIVVVRENGTNTVILAMPEGQVILGGDDIAVGLPNGAKISKTADGEFLASQLDGNGPARISTTAHDAITGFMAHFHPTH